MFPRLRSWLSAILQRRSMERDMADELAFHLAQRTGHLIRSGLSPDEAARRARLEFGATERYKDECRQSRGLRLTDELGADLLYALRGLRRSPGFSAVVVISLALGIGANSAMFSVVNGILLRPLPYRDQDRLVSLREEMPEAQSGLKNFRPLPPVNFLLHRDRLTSFEDLMAMDFAVYQLTGVAEPEQLQAGWVTANWCSFLGVRPAIGRCFTAEEEATRAQVAMLSYELWRRQFAGDPRAVGRALALQDYSGGVVVTIIGVLPPKFHLGWDADLWLPLSESQNYRTRNDWWDPALTIARLKPEVPLPQARAELLATQRRMYPRQYEGAGGREIHVSPLVESMTDSVRPALTVLMGVVGLVLLITCANSANLMLSRGAERMREVAVRASLGAGRLRICRQMLTESAVLALLGGGLGLLIAHWLVKGVKALATVRLPRVNDIHMDWRVLGFTAGVSLLSGLLFGLLPALRLSTVDLADGMKSGGTASMGGRRHQRLMNLLVVFEVALCVVAMTGAGLLINSFLRLKGVDPGFRPEGVAVASVNGSESDGGEQRILGEILDRVASMPGVEAAGMVNYPPPLHVNSIQDFRLPGGAAGPRSDFRIVSQGYFEALGIPILRGRGFERRDDATAPRVIVLSESVARRYWPNQDPVGQSVLLREYRKEVSAQIAGVVRDVRQTGPRNQLDEAIFSDYRQAGPVSSLTLLVRTRGGAEEIMPSLKREIRAVDRGQTLQRFTTMNKMMADELAESRFYTVLLAGYGALALLLTTVGIGGLVAYAVSRRTQEIALRVSFGASRINLLAMFTAGTAKLAWIGLLLGIPASYAVTRLLRSLLFEVTPTDPVTLVAVAVVLTAVSLLACCGAAFRATNVEPGSVLRHE